MRSLTDEELEKLKDYGWEVVNDLPLEIECLDDRESKANRFAAEYIIKSILNDW